MAVFELWSIQYQLTLSKPKYIDIRFKSFTYFDVEFNGIIGQNLSYCNPEAVQYHTYSSIDATVR
jgi:hypothetical protein